MTTIIKASGRIANATDADILRADPILTNGSLALFEPRLMGDRVNNGVTAMPNIASEEARALIPSGSLDGELWSNAPAAASGLIEKTGKGGLHVLMSRTQGQAGRGAQLNLPLPLRNYLVANATHKFGLFVWAMRTRATASPPEALYQRNTFAYKGPQSAPPYSVDQRTVILFSFGNGDSWYNPANITDYYAVQQSIGQSTLGTPGRYAAVTKGGDGLNKTSQGPTPATGADFVATFNMGNVGGSNNAAASNANNGPGDILYRWYLEDFTVSGRTAAALSSLDESMRATAFASGGRFASDTFTDPATLP